MQKIWHVLLELTERVWKDHAEVGMLGGHHDPDHAIRVAQMAVEVSEEPNVWLLAGTAGLVHNADRIIQHRLGLNRRRAPKENVRELVLSELSVTKFNKADRELIVDAVLNHDGKNDPSDSPVLVALMDADRLVNAEPDLIIRAGQFFSDLPVVDPIYLEKDPDANYHDPRSVLRDVMETIVWLTPGDDNLFYVRLPKARAMAVQRKKFFDDFLKELLLRREESGFYPYPPELRELRDRFALVSKS